MKTTNFTNGPQQSKTSITPENQPLHSTGWAADERSSEEAGQPPPPEPVSIPGGGRTTISPPVKVTPSPVRLGPVLSSGIDTLYLAINTIWQNQRFFEKLEEGKKLSAFHDEPQAIHFDREKTDEKWIFEIMAHGSKGYEWMIQNKEYNLKIGNWTHPKSRPSIMVEIRSEPLWNHGPEESVNRIIEFIEYRGGFITEIKPSRVDVCLDLLMDADKWTMDIIHNRVTRSKYAASHLHNADLTGISIGKGHLCARLYDKPLEIKIKKSKEWMYSIWGIKRVPSGKKIIRTEFQLRRQAMNELNIHTIEDLFNHTKNIWGYCTQKWLRFQDNPGKHHTQRKDLDWWIKITEGFNGSQKPKPIIRAKAMQQDRSKLAFQAYGILTSIHAVSGNSDAQLTHVGDIIKPLMEEMRQLKIDRNVIKDDIRKKEARYRRDEAKADRVRAERQENGFPYLRPAKPVKVLEPELTGRQSSRRRLCPLQHQPPTCSRLAGDGQDQGGPPE
ncbi:MAG: hypothetical protein ACOZF0_11015 [Thermodesulfobacteriota bacterium]